ncbi:MAG: hypothetical protein H6601_12810 [Flavobacteriales bacterium]|nr:hypothetical protein [Flavobacteriales bacterium]
MSKHLFDPNINICEDMDVSLRIVNSGVPIFQLARFTTFYVAASDSFTHGDLKKWERELDALKKIFNRPELQGKLQLRERWRLLSMCHYHLAIKAFEKDVLLTFWHHALLSFFLYPRGYNGKTMKPLAVMMLYSIPILGRMFKAIRNQLR